MVGTISRRDCLRLAVAAWLGSLFAGPLVPKWPVPAASNYAMPIEGLGLGIRFTNVLRWALGITTIGKLLDVLSGREPLRKLSRRYKPDDYETILSFEPARMEIRTRLAAYFKSGPVPFATLTRVETEVLNLVVQAHSDREIGAQLGITKRVVKEQLDSLYHKMQGLCAPYPLETELIRGRIHAWNGDCP